MLAFHTQNIPCKHLEMQSSTILYHPKRLNPERGWLPLLPTGVSTCKQYPVLSKERPPSPLDLQQLAKQWLNHNCSKQTYASGLSPLQRSLMYCFQSSCNGRKISYLRNEAKITFSSRSSKGRKYYWDRKPTQFSNLPPHSQCNCSMCMLLFVSTLQGCDSAT